MLVEGISKGEPRGDKAQNPPGSRIMEKLKFSFASAPGQREFTKEHVGPMLGRMLDSQKVGDVYSCALDFSFLFRLPLCLGPHAYL